MEKVKSPVKSEEKPSANTSYYEHVKKESRASLIGAIPSIISGVVAALALWLLSSLTLMPMLEGIHWFGYSLTQMLGYVVMAGLAFFALKILVNIHSALKTLVNLLSCEIGTPNAKTLEATQG